MSCQRSYKCSSVSNLDKNRNEIDFDFFDYSSKKDDIRPTRDRNFKPTHFITEAIIETNRNTYSSTNSRPTDNNRKEEKSLESHIFQNLNETLNYNLDHNLVNCIAYENEEFDDDTDSLSSLSDSTGTSEFTNVTPMSSSNTSLNVVKNSISEYNTKVEKDKCYHFKDTLDLGPRVFEENDTSSMIKSLENISIQGSSTSSRISSLSNGRLKFIRKNRTFTNEQLRKIDRENDILLKKIMAYAKPKPKQPSTVHNFHPTKTSAAINRLKQQKQIEHDNYILLNKIRGVKQTRKSIFG